MASVCTQSYFGTKAITCHSFNKDQTQVALSMNDEVIYVYQSQDSGKWLKTAELREHTGKVTGIDWAPISDQIVSCGADRNAYVWKQENGSWKPVLVLIRINRGAITVKWSPLENKFAVGSAARVISVCYFDEDNNWWISKHIKKPIRSSVLSISWHPNNILIASGTSDFKCRIFSTYIREIEAKPGPTTWGKKMPFGHVMGEYGQGVGGWVHGVSFNVEGDKLAWVAHDSSVSFVTGEMDQPSIIRTKFLPFSDCCWISDSSIVAVGFDCNPMIFSLKDNAFQFNTKCDEAEKGSKTGQLSGRAMFQAMDRMATSQSAETLKTLHKNSILEVIPINGGFSTAGSDGQIIQWNNDNLSRKFQNMKI